MNTQKTGRSKLVSQAVQFFYDHAGYSWDAKKETEIQGHKRTAKELAKAERDAASAGITFEWGIDHFVDNPSEYYSIARDEYGKVVASLWGIDNPSREYQRVVQAELALEALTA